VTDDALERFVREITVTPAQDGLAKDKTSLKRNIDIKLISTHKE